MQLISPVDGNALRHCSEYLFIESQNNLENMTSGFEMKPIGPQTDERDFPLRKANWFLWNMLSLLVTLMLTSAAFAQNQSVEGEIVAVDVASGSLEIAYQAPLGRTSATLDVSKKAVITINDALGTLAELRKGQKASITWNKDLDVITAITATGNVQAGEFVAITEFDGSFPTLTQDGLTIFYEAKGISEPMITTANRETSDSPFANVKPLFPGRHPTVSGDGLELIFLQIPVGKKTRTLHVATRKTLRDQFGHPQEIRELSKFSYPRGGCLSPDGLTFCFRSSEGDGELVWMMRRSRTSPWSAPQPLLASQIERNLGGNFTWPWLSDDRLTLLVTLEKGPTSGKSSNLYLLRRETPQQPFSLATEIENELLPRTVRSPRYVETTGELFLSGVPNAESSFGIGIMKNFSISP